MIPNDELCKAFLCITEGLSHNITCWNQAHAMICLQGFYLMPVVVQWYCCVQLLLLAVGDGLLLACLLLLAQLLACPLPPGLAPGCLLSFSSWDGLLVLLLLILILSFSWIPWFYWRYLCDAVQELLLFLVWCSAGRVSVAPLVLPLWSTAWHCWLLWCCQLQLPGSVTKLLVSCVFACFTQVVLIHSLAVLCICYAPSHFVPPVIFNEQMLTCSNTLNDAMAKYLP
jgi:hypothetical protein